MVETEPGQGTTFIRITQSLLERIQNFTDLTGIREPLYVEKAA